MNRSGAIFSELAVPGRAVVDSQPLPPPPTFHPPQNLRESYGSSCWSGPLDPPSPPLPLVMNVCHSLSIIVLEMQYICPHMHFLLSMNVELECITAVV